MSQDDDNNLPSPRSSIKRLASTDSSSGSWIIEGVDEACGDDIVESVFQWFAARHISRGNPETIYQQHLQTKPITLHALKELSGNGLPVSGLLKRRLTKG